MSCINEVLITTSNERLVKIKNNVNFCNYNVNFYCFSCFFNNFDFFKVLTSIFHNLIYNNQFEFATTRPIILGFHHHGSVLFPWNKNKWNNYWVFIIKYRILDKPSCVIYIVFCHIQLIFWCFPKLFSVMSRIFYSCLLYFFFDKLFHSLTHGSRWIYWIFSCSTLLKFVSIICLARS